MFRRAIAKCWSTEREASDLAPGSGLLSAAALVAILAALPEPAAAHQSSVTYARVEASADRREVTYQLRLSSRDLYEALALDRDRDATNREILQGEDRLFDYVLERITFEVQAQRCDVERRGVDVVEKSERFARLAVGVVCPDPIEELVIDYDLFFDLDELHTGLLSIEGDVVQLTIDENRFVWSLGEAPPSGALSFVRSGVDHILFGLDHILFLISLLLMAVLARSETGGFRPRPLREGLAYTGVIVTSFTVAHSLTLIAAALGWIELPGRLVESIIAASIAYVAIENVLRPDPPRRYLVTFAFGLVHGLGFASMLRPLLPPEGVVGPLLAFNVGVELGQLGVVVVALPLLYALASALGGDRYRRVILPIGGAALAAIGLIWLIERAFELPILGL